MVSFTGVILLWLCMHAHAATITYDFNITWVTANPDGMFARPVMGINGQWPLPDIRATIGDRLVVNVLNLLGNQSTSLHFHGLYMNGTTQMDGPVGVSQCSIPPGDLFTYNFTIDQPGTYWYHSHFPGQYPDGLRGALIVNDPNSPYKGKYDEERVLTVSDWYHEQMPVLLKSFISVTNPTGAEPIPKSALFNDTQNLTTAVDPGKTYMFRIINIGAFAGQYIWFEGHTMQIVEVDGIYTNEAAADMIYVAAAQRYSVLLTAKNDTSTNFAYVASMDQTLFDTIPPSLNPNVTGWLVYDDTAPLPTPALVDTLDPFDDFFLVPTDNESLLADPDYIVPLTVLMINLADGANYASFNSIPYVTPKVPTLYTALSTGQNATNPTIYATNTNAFVLERNQIIDIVLNNNDSGRHPFHLHGHAFQAIARSADDAGNYVGNETFPAVPMRRDTFTVRPNGNIVLRFRADNPGVWLFHCHIEWHIASGLVATFIEAPTSLQQSSLPIPFTHLAACTNQDIPTSGNAAGNTNDDVFDLRGANKAPGPLPAGFTSKGIVALVCSVVSGLLGIGTIAWYGAGEIGTQKPGKETEKVVAGMEGDGKGKGVEVK